MHRLFRNRFACEPCGCDSDACAPGAPAAVPAPTTAPAAPLPKG
jgi:hypothetical protein